MPIQSNKRLAPKPDAKKILTLSGFPWEYQLAHDTAKGGVTITDLRSNGHGATWHSYESLEMLNFGTRYHQLLSIHYPYPLLAPDIIDVSTFDAPVMIPLHLLIQNDVHYQGGPIQVHTVKDIKGGEIGIDVPSASLVFTPDPHYVGIRSFDYHARSGRYVNQEGAHVWLRTPDQPKDPLFFEQKYLFEIKATNLPYHGKNIHVLVTDDGILPKHRDLQPHGQSASYLPADNTPHTLMVSGVIAATPNDLDIVGIAPEVTLDAMQISFHDLRETDLTLWREYDVVNNSWGGEALIPLQFLGDQSEEGAQYAYVLRQLQAAVEQGRGGLGTNVVWASGNQEMQDSSFSPIENSRYGFTVSGIHPKIFRETEHMDRTAAWSSTTGAAILISAPDDHIPVLTCEELHVLPGVGLAGLEGTCYVGGTSFAAPMVSAVIALMLEANPKLGYRDVQEILSLSARHPDHYDLAWQHNHAPHVNADGMVFHQEKGAGMLNAKAAIQLAETWTAKEYSANEQLFASLPLKKLLRVGPDQQIVAFSLPEVHSKGWAEFAEIKAILHTDEVNNFSFRLISPSGTESVLYDGAKPHILHEKLVPEIFQRDLYSTHFRGEPTAGIWNVTLIYQGTIIDEKDIFGYSTTSSILASLEFTLTAREHQRTHFITDDLPRGDIPAAIAVPINTAIPVTLETLPQAIQAALLTPPPSTPEPVTPAESAAAATPKTLTLHPHETRLNMAMLSEGIVFDAHGKTLTIGSQPYPLLLEGTLLHVIGTDLDDTIQLSAGMTGWPGRGNDVVLLLTEEENGGVYYHLPWHMIGHDIIYGFNPTSHTLSATTPLAREMFEVTSMCHDEAMPCSSIVKGDGWSLEFHQLALDVDAFLQMLTMTALPEA